jgi:hypothetical protein
MTSPRYFSLPTGPLFRSLSKLRNHMEVNTKLYNVLLTPPYVLNVYNQEKMEKAPLLLLVSTSDQKIITST